MTHPLVLALAICAGAAVLEGVLAGRGVKQRFLELRVPRLSPPLRIWIAIGAAYYAICFVVLYRLLVLPPNGLRTAALSLIVMVLLANAFWNYLFFRLRSLRLSFVAGVLYSLAALGLLTLLFKLDRIAAWCLLPYVLYLSYANWWDMECCVRTNTQLRHEPLPSRGPLGMTLG
ncbi:MAG TPA: TspO/MBR family protein [Gemmatimonadales bacterium]|nr:TspO/MBR family protein [Gemmatimonadales bacterium]